MASGTIRSQNEKKLKKIFFFRLNREKSKLE